MIYWLEVDSPILHVVLTFGVAQLLALLVTIVLGEAGIWYCISITIQLALLRRLVGVLSLALDQGRADHGQPEPVCDDHDWFQSIQMLWMIEWINYGWIRGRGGRRSACYPFNFSLFNFSFVYNLSTAKFIVLHRNCYDILHSEDIITRAVTLKNCAKKSEIFGGPNFWSQRK